MTRTKNRTRSRTAMLLGIALLNLRLKDLLGPVTRVKQKKKKHSPTAFPRAGKFECPLDSHEQGGWRRGTKEVTYLRLVAFCITHL